MRCVTGEKNFFELWLLVAVSSIKIMKPVLREKLVQVSTQLWSGCRVLSGIIVHLARVFG